MTGNMVQISREVADFLALVLSRQNISAADPNFDETAAMVGRARRELMAALGPAPSSNGHKSPVKAVGKGRRANSNTPSPSSAEQH